MRTNRIRKMSGYQEGEGAARPCIRHVDMQGVLTVRTVDLFHFCGGLAGSALIPDGWVGDTGFEVFSENRTLGESAAGYQKQG